MFVPEYNKPEAPGLHLNFDNTVSVYHIVAPEESFEEAAQSVFDLLKEAETRYPGWPRTFFLDIAGHDGEAAGFDSDFYEFQQEFLFSVIAPFVAALETPLTGPLVNPDPQRNDFPDRLNIGGDRRPHRGTVIPDAD
ncbi:MAG: hypothetical protein R3284_03290 [Rubricoccaceae bacterium]|nr:hypothetical protein [Rubricoccaceae bacterium]